MESARFNVLHLVLLILLIGIGAVLVFPLLEPRASSKTACISNLKQLGTSMQIYLGDFDDRFPPKTWHDELMPYAKNEDLSTCTEVADAEKKWGYAMNYELLGRESAKLGNPEITPMLFEIDALAKDVVANAGARSTNRHRGKSAVGGAIICRLDTSTRYFRTGKPLDSKERY